VAVRNVKFNRHRFRCEGYCADTQPYACCLHVHFNIVHGSQNKCSDLHAPYLICFWLVSFDLSRLDSMWCWRSLWCHQLNDNWPTWWWNCSCCHYWNITTFLLVFFMLASLELCPFKWHLVFHGTFCPFKWHSVPSSDILSLQMTSCLSWDILSLQVTFCPFKWHSVP
jgi:hypothetical protein